MKFVRKIDENGMFIEDTFVEELTEFTIETPCPQGFYNPRWDGEKWVEGMSQAEIDAIKNMPTEQPLEIRNRADIDYIAIMTGVDL
ncbi:MAG: hypothetical protein K0R54_2224 [Clostridiaceae bacterium]|jgi:hypothetical protein|nr:hypothetical protein [Clostridiaceae bacterium]